MSEQESSADPKVNAEQGGGGAPGAEAEIPLQSMVKTSLQHMEVHYGADIHLQATEDLMLEHMDAKRRL